jgi:uncharacterized membrane protein
LLVCFHSLYSYWFLFLFGFIIIIASIYEETFASPSLFA